MARMVKVRDLLDNLSDCGTDAAIVCLSVVGFGGLKRFPTDAETAAALTEFRRQHGDPDKAEVCRIFAGILDIELPLEVVRILLMTDEDKAAEYAGRNPI